MRDWKLNRTKPFGIVLLNEFWLACIMHVLSCFLGPMTFEAIGTIDAKIDCGYLVSVKLGSETLAGVLYHPDQPGSSKSDGRGCMDIIPYNPNTQGAGRRSRRRKRRGGGDPAHPKPNRSGYNFFFAKKHSELKSIHPYREREFTKMIGEAWNNLSLEEKAVSTMTRKQ